MKMLEREIIFYNMITLLEYSNHDYKYVVEVINKNNSNIKQSIRLSKLRVAEEIYIQAASKLTFGYTVNLKEVAEEVVNEFRRKLNESN